MERGDKLNVPNPQKWALKSSGNFIRVHQKLTENAKYILLSMEIIDIIIANKIKAMTEKSKHRISLSELESGESLTDNYTERSS